MVTKRKKPTLEVPVELFDFVRDHVVTVDVSDSPREGAATGTNQTRTLFEAEPLFYRGKPCPHCPHPMKGIHHYKTGKCKMCPCKGPAGDVKGGYASTLAASAPPAKKTRTKKPKEPKPEPLPTDLGGDFGSMLSRDFKRITKKGKKR